MHLSAHTALQSTNSHAGRRPASRLPPCPLAVRLLPFALWPAFPTAPVGRHPHDYYGSSVAVGLAPGRPSRLPSGVDVRARRRWPVRPLEWAQCPPPTPRRVRAPATLTRYRRGPATDAVSRERVFAPLGTGVQAVRPSPYRAGLAGHRPQRLPAVPAFPPCCCPRWLSPPGRVGDPEVTLLRTPPRCTGDR